MQTRAVYSSAQLKLLKWRKLFITNPARHKGHIPRGDRSICWTEHFLCPPVLWAVSWWTWKCPKNKWNANWEEQSYKHMTETWTIIQNKNDKLPLNYPKGLFNHSIIVITVPWAYLGRCMVPRGHISWKYQPDSRLPADAHPCLGVSERSQRLGGEPGSGTAPSLPQNLDPCPWRSLQPSRRTRTVAKLSSWLAKRYPSLFSNRDYRPYILIRKVIKWFLIEGSPIFNYNINALIPVMFNSRQTTLKCRMGGKKTHWPWACGPFPLWRFCQKSLWPPGGRSPSHLWLEL